MMIKETASETLSDKINILIIDFIGIKIGIDLSQISEICAQKEAEEKSRNIFRIDEKIPNFKKKVSYTNPRVLIINARGCLTGIVIEMPQEIISLPFTSILPLPAVVEMYKENTPFWGVTLQKNNIVLLIDLLRLI